MIRIDGVSVGSRLLPLSFECGRGEIVHLIGPNGSGKSTLLSAIAGTEDYSGHVFIGDVDSKGYSLEDLAMVRAYLSQSEKPAFNLPVFQYLSLSIPTKHNVSVDQLNNAVAELSQEVQIQDKLHRPIHQLSGGEWQRVRLAGICLQVWPTINPMAKLLLLDEPAASLDIGQEKLLYQLIRKVADQGIVILMANHDLNRSLKHADKAVLLEQGVMVKFGEVEDIITEEHIRRVFCTDVKLEMIRGSNVLIFD
ncbi:vitamin B12 ABC transporter ATP-binding protein BtuD [Vibrio sp. S4M6]|uniref:vitamin B12 ABC transporter ATP-binding protein BtuD n=1 Tax=Vibrio sinus TaxID=2946865 RepID=UPI00202AAFD5|nr:vitamin B12 ABC transporter ATP-binding protein BtuD [Vibrio sinus]MCL9783443.1 vitamin B12 ABC transporter ATP-binding protein BtuD [Vibrio sinus]